MTKKIIQIFNLLILSVSIGSMFTLLNKFCVEIFLRSGKFEKPGRPFVRQMNSLSPRSRAIEKNCEAHYIKLFIIESLVINKYIIQLQEIISQFSGGQGRNGARKAHEILDNKLFHPEFGATQIADTLNFDCDLINGRPLIGEQVRP